MRRRDALSVLALAALPGCAGARRPAAESASEPVPEPEPETEPFRVLAPTERVPGFRVVDSAGAPTSARELIGNQAFVVAFFATWCRVCEMKLPILGEALRDQTALRLLLVSLDEQDSLGRVPSFLARVGLARPFVHGLRYPRFALSYDPLETVPALAVVGRNGYLVDYQVGYSTRHQPRLQAAIEVAGRLAPDAPPFLGDPATEPPDL